MKDRESPFTPGKPVPPEFFVGRERELKDVHRRLSQVAHNKSEYIFVQGEKGVGKSSFADLVGLIAAKEYNFLPVHCYLGDVSDPRDIPEVVMTQFLQATEKTIFERLRETFKQYIKDTSLGLFGLVNIKVELRPQEKEYFYRSFFELLRGIYGRIKDKRDGLVVVLDDINGLASHPLFAPKIKSMVDGMASTGGEFPLLFMLVGTPERRQEMIMVHESVARIFWVVTLEPVGPADAKRFFESTFGSVGKELEPGALKMMVKASGGFPVMMQEIGEAVFWADGDDKIDALDASTGIMNAAESVGTKYMDRQIYKAIRSPRYKRILRYMGLRAWELGPSFERRTLLRVIPPEEARSLDNFLRRMLALGLLLRVGRGKYRFPNELYRLYVMMEAARARAEG